MPRVPLLQLGRAASLALAIATPARAETPGTDGGDASRPTGREALGIVPHEWKGQIRGSLLRRRADRPGTRPDAGGASLVHELDIGPFPKHFGRLSPEERLAYLRDLRGRHPFRFASELPAIAHYLRRDDRLRMAQSQNCEPINGLLPDTPLIRYLHFHRNLDPARFDRRFPVWGAFLAENDLLRSNGACIPTQIVPPPVPVTPPVGIPAFGPPVGGGPLPIRPVPEPGGLTLLLLGAAAAMTPPLLRRWRRRPAARV